jgi:aspartate ammonia-lyase
MQPCACKFTREEDSAKLAPKIGYDRAAEIAQESAKTGRRVREIAREKKVIDGKLECAGHVRALKAVPQPRDRRTPERC